MAQRWLHQVGPERSTWKRKGRGEKLWRRDCDESTPAAMQFDMVCQYPLGVT